MKEIFTLIMISFISIGFAQGNSDDLRLHDYFQEVSSDNVFKTEGYYNWGASIIKTNDGQYHLFYSRWPKKYSFTGWLTYSEIAHATSKSPSGPWKYTETALKSRGNNHWDAITAHNPKIKYFEGKYYLYYISTNMGKHPITEEELVETSKVGYSHPNWKILRPNQRTGVAVSNSINGPWKRLDQPLIEPSGPIETLTVNPAIAQDKNGKYYLIVKGDKPHSLDFTRNQAVAISDHPTGPFKIQEKPVIDYMDTEDMSIWYDKKRERFYGVFHAHEFIGMITSKEGLDWEKANEYVLMSKKIKMAEGSMLIPDRLERPFIYTENGEPSVLSLAVKKGDDSYTIFIPIEKSGNQVRNNRQADLQEAKLGAVHQNNLHVRNQLSK